MAEAKIGEADFCQEKLVKRATAAIYGYLAEDKANIVLCWMRHLGGQSCYSGNRGSVEGQIPRGAIKGAMDMSWITDRIAVGGGIWVESKMAEVVRAGVTHIIDMQIEFDDTAIAEPFGVEVLWNPVDDDFQPKPPEVLHRGVEFALNALEEPDAKVYIHCAAGVHRAPMMALAVLRAMGWELEDAKELILGRRYVVDFADVYVKSVESFMANYEAKEPKTRN
jgi:protein-tyrosine phosphatase